MLETLRDRLNTDDSQLWLLIGLCAALVVTLEAVEEAVEGAWPHQRRARRMTIGERRGQPLWGVVALLILPGALLAILIVATMVWQDVERTDGMVTGGILLGIGWVLFLAGSIDRLRLRRVLTQGGIALPLVLVVVLAIAIFLLLTEFLAIRPSLETVREAVPLI